MGIKAIEIRLKIHFFVLGIIIIIVILLLYYYYTIRQENISRNIILLMGEKERERENEMSE